MPVKLPFDYNVQTSLSE